MKNKFSYILMAGMTFLSVPAFSQATSGQGSIVEFDILIYLLVVLMALLALVIGGLSTAIVKGVKGDIRIFRTKNNINPHILLPLLLAGLSLSVNAQTVAAPQPEWYTATNLLYVILGFFG
ncbi:MAG: hypothetical protein HYZ42_02005 [Bacteroidetes bacterium]|nr:hypothetical protein [Bacteroidota bacterium]